MPTPLKVTIELSDDGVVQGLKVATKTVEGAAQEMRTSLAGMGEGAKTASRHVDGLSGSLKEWRQHSRTEARYTGFLAQQVAGLGFASKGAASEVTGLISALAFAGSGIGAGFAVAAELGRTLAHHFHALAEEEAKAREELKKYANDLNAMTAQLERDAKIAVLTAQGKSKAQIQAELEIKPLIDERAKKQRELDTAVSNLVAKREGEATSEAEAIAKLSGADEQELERMRERIRLLDETIHKRTIALGTEATVAIRGEVQGDGGKAEEQAAKEHQLRMLQFAAEARKDEERIWFDFQVKKQEILSRDNATTREKEEELAAELDATRRKLAEKGEERRTKEQAAEDKHRMHQIKAAYDAAVAIEKFFKDKGDEALKHEKEREAKYKQIMMERLHTAQQFGSEMGKNLMEMATGAESVEKAFANMAKAALHLIFDMVKKAIEAYAMEAAAAAAAANAGIPGIGIPMAMAAAAAMEAAVMALIDSMPSAEVGMSRVPGDMPVFVHRDEAILTRSDAEDWRRGGRGAGGDTFQLHVHGAVDGESVRRTLNSPPFVREFRDLIRRGRL